MSKRSSKKSGESIAELDDALGTLPDGAADAGADGADDNPLEQVDVSGTTSFESAEFAAGYDGSKAEDEDRRGAEGEVGITVPEILEIRGVQSSSAIKTLLDKRLIIAKGRKETVGRPMLYGTSKEFLMQFGLKDLTELPNVEDFEDLAGGGDV